MSGLAPVWVALIRSLMGAGIAALTVYASLSAEGSADAEGKIWAAVLAAAAYITTRGGIEGIFDQNTKPDMNHPPATDVDNLPKPAELDN